MWLHERVATMGDGVFWHLCGTSDELLHENPEGSMRVGRASQTLASSGGCSSHSWGLGSELSAQLLEGRA
jgi:hypothetical protein